MGRKRKEDKFDMVYATPSLVAETKRDIAMLEHMLDGKEIDSGVSGRADKIVDKEGVRREIEKKRKMIERYTPKKLTGEAANRAFKLARELEKRIKDAMPSAKDYFQRASRKNDGYSKQQSFEQAVNAQFKFQTDKKLQQDIVQYKALMGQLDPDNHELRNIERLRRAR